MTAPPAAKRACPPALSAAVSTLEVPGLGQPYGILVLADGTRVISTEQNRLQLLTPAGLLATLAGGNDHDDCDDDDDDDATLRYDASLVDGQGPAARFNEPGGMTVDAAGHIVVVDTANDALRRVSKAGAGGAVRTLAGSGEAGFADGQGAAVRFNHPAGLARDKDGSILVADRGNHAVRRVTMEGDVSTVAGNGEAGYAEGEGTAARFSSPADVVVDKEGTIVVADRDNGRLRKIVGRQVTTLAGGSEAGTADGAGAGACFKEPIVLALDERGRLLVAERGRADTLRVVDASLAPPAWMGPVNPAAQAAEEKALETEKLLGDYGKLVEDGDLADVVFVVGEERLPAHRVMLAARSKYFAGLFKSGMAEGSKEEVTYEDVSAFAFRVLLRFLYTGELPALEGAGGHGGHGGSGGGASAGGWQGDGEGVRTRTEGAYGKGMEGGKGKEDDKEEEEAESEVQELLRVADRFQAEGLYGHCLKEFGRTLTVQTAIQQLVWAHSRGPAGARQVALEYLTANCHAIQVAVSCLACDACE